MFVVFIIVTLVVTLAVLIHYEFLSRMSVHLLRPSLKPRFKIITGVLLALVAHAIEIWLFALAYYVMHTAGLWGQLLGHTDGSLLDCVYFSFTTYSTLGFGDIYPSGGLRYLTGIESLTGLVLITWTASFLYLAMEKEWGKD
ncbi:potassium channel family protein [Dasania sp. GY-MA-18]|uniref:Potassium channel family protein n=1 Tax=Dasania phycosphaerae TaxID=2950436 RepID=A0A9J6RQX5_9GAMM|nr:MULTISPECIES: potassium channel family protein [Dasania]MCR8924326.1 potassium channel family protein [Dasania sp. GY-MA-18]MCZ0866979.1 potassium channel family protein [Dasania phycosphaerae]MCZ0870483.1 potassium channel family protein [Dasania phycosphaerae]